MIPAERVRSLVWSEDSLIDWAAGGVVYDLTGVKKPSRMYWSYPFDGVIAVDDFVVLYDRFGTKGVVLRGGKLRELNRSYYHAKSYEYPICLVKHEGRLLLIHCPESYNVLQIDDAATGERLTARSSKADDFFHSRLTPNADGTRFFSAGWLWHPWDAVAYFDIAEALRNPAHLDSAAWCAATSRHVGLAEESSACWQTNTRTIVAASDEDEMDEEEVAELGDSLYLRPRGVVVFDTTERKVLSSIVLPQPAGKMMPVGETHVVAFNQHPRLIRLSDGAVEHEWPSIASGAQISSIVHRDSAQPPIALDPERRRFGVAQDDGIHVVELD